MKNKNFAFRVSERDLEIIKNNAINAKMTTTDFITKSALHKKIVVIDDLSAVISELKSVGNNLNQLAVLANMGRIATVDLSGFTEKFSQIYAEICKLTEVI